MATRIGITLDLTDEQVQRIIKEVSDTATQRKNMMASYVEDSQFTKAGDCVEDLRKLEAIAKACRRALMDKGITPQS